MQGSPPPSGQCVPPIDWDRPPWNRWAFQNISQVLRTAPIHSDRSHAPVSLPTESKDIGVLQFEDSKNHRITVNQLLEDTYTDGFLVIHRNRIVRESYYNGMQPHTLHLGQSVTKSVVATTAAVLMEQGLLDVSVPVSHYVPELENTAWRGATLQHVLDMTTGVRYDETYDHRDSDMGKTDVACGWKPLPQDINTDGWPDSLWEQILGLTHKDAEHGERFLYRSIETEVLAFIMERVTGQRLPAIISQWLWAPMGAEEDALITVDKYGCSTASGGLNASLRDYGRFGLLLLNEGMAGGKQVVPKWWTDDIRRGNHGLFSEAGREVFARVVTEISFG